MFGVHPITSLDHPKLRWALKADDLTYVLPWNLRGAADGHDPAAPRILGRPLRLPGIELKDSDSLQSQNGFK